MGWLLPNHKQLNECFTKSRATMTIVFYYAFSWNSYNSNCFHTYIPYG